MGSQILKSEMSKTFILCLQFTSDIQSQVITDARLECIRLRVRIRDRSAGEMSLCQPSSGWLPFLFWVIGKNEGAKRKKEIGSVFHLLCPRYIGPLTPTAPLQPLGYVGSFDLYLFLRQCNSRFRCTKLFNTTLPSF